MSGESPAAVIVDSTGVEVNVLDDAGVKRLATDARVDSDPKSRRDVFVAAFAKEGVAATTFFMLVDLDGAGYPHDLAATKLSITTALGAAFKENAGSKWAVDVGVVTRIDGTDADITYFAGASMFLRDTSTLSIQPTTLVMDYPVSAEVSAGALANGVSNFDQNPAPLTTASAIEDPTGATPNPAVGDIVIRARLISGGGTLDFISSIQYFVEA
jgi:hypothetical protein